MSGFTTDEQGFDLWAEASADSEAIQRQARLDLADRQLEAVMPFLLAARTPAEYVHRSWLAQDSIERIAMQCGLDPAELRETVARRYQLYREALAEGTDPLDTITQATHPQGAGPEKPDGHSTGPAPDAYSEIPPGPERGPVPQVTQVRQEAPGAVTEATGARQDHTALLQAVLDGGLQPFELPPGTYTITRPLRAHAVSMGGGGSGSGASFTVLAPPLQRTADAGYLQSMPPDTGTGPGSLDMETNPGAPSLPAGMPDSTASEPLTPPGIGQATSSRDPVHRQVLAVAASVRRSNPRLPAAECRRVARLVVGRYLTADLSSSVMSDDPGGGPKSGGGGGGGGTGPIGHALEWQGAKSLLPGGGAAAGEAGGLMDAAELAAL